MRPAETPICPPVAAAANTPPTARVVPSPADTSQLPAVMLAARPTTPLKAAVGVIAPPVAICTSTVEKPIT